MRIALFGATGRTGRLVLDLALEAGHDVRVLVRSPDRLGKKLRSECVVKGDMADDGAVAAILNGSWKPEAVIMAAGPVKGSPAEMLPRAAHAIILAMARAGVRRLVWLTGAGVIDDRDERAVSRVVIRGLMKLLTGKVLRASQQAYNTVVSSDLEYVVVRPPMLSNEPGGSGLVAGYTPPRPIPVGRGDLAQFLLTAATTKEYVRESPMVGYTERKR